MSKKDHNNATPVRKADAIEVTLPENLSAYLTPLMVLFGSVIIGAAILFAGNRVSQTMEAKLGVLGTNTNTQQTDQTDQTAKLLSHKIR